MARHALLLSCLLPLVADAASFDCAQASHPVERAICADPALSKMDEQLATTFRRARQLSIEGDNQLLEEQRSWLRETRQTCTAQADIAACARNRYDWRLEELASLPHAIENFPETAALQLNEASAHFDFSLALDAPCAAAICEGSGRLAVLAKGSSKPLQVIALPGVFLSRRADGQPLVNSAQLYAYQGVINVGDFNFDGAEDFAVQNGNRGSYGGPSYDVFLYEPRVRAFRYSRALSALIESTLGFFGVDEQAQRLETFAKSGCCWHQRQRYQVAHNQPVPVWRITEDASSVHNEFVHIDTEELIDGKWQITETKNIPQKEYFAEP
ncbi:conserved exported hypothetical protein [Pseudomonas sp. 8AS]|uniref:lysozyme inhibitor LprI family protein n=1 Tax=Pseudomonas sp. 8AS TaxID=2653163 RepID=UPI0012F038D4|nr:lysozyme inhibitor LprI family protein [Pseudomonas sp. 8AS]VXB19147.1 conserved exported hypothetical protein [Pseudomonas sp. 8AS]